MVCDYNVRFRGADGGGSVSLRTASLEAMGGGTPILLVPQRSHTSIPGRTEGNLVGVGTLSNLLYYNMICLNIKGV